MLVNVCYGTAMEQRSLLNRSDICQGRIQDFKSGGPLKIIAPSGGFRVKNHDFTKKNQIFTNFRESRAVVSIKLHVLFRIMLLIQ